LSVIVSQTNVTTTLKYERERRRESWEGSERHTIVLERGNRNKNFAVLKVPRQCPLVLLVEERLVFGICSILIFAEAAVGRYDLSTAAGLLHRGTENA
jgi:hypothetical protein